jgi:anti-sigma factor RsiW
MDTRTTTVSEMDIQALVDNELNWEDEKRVRAFIAADAKAKATYELLRRQKVLLKEWWDSTKAH